MVWWGVIGVCLCASIFRYGKSSAQVMIRWSLQCGFIYIPKSVKEQRIRENGDVFDFSLSARDMTTLVQLSIHALGTVIL